MRKFLIILSVLIVALFAIGYVVYRNAGTLLERIVSEKTNLQTTIASLNFNPEEIVIKDFQIANPKEAALPVALNVNTLSVKAPYKNYLKNPIVIQDIHLDNIYINIQLYDQSQEQGNWQTLIAQMQEKEQKPSFFAVKRETVIQRLLITNIQIDLILADGSRRMLSPIRKLEFYDISSSEGIPIQKIVQAIIQHMVRSIFLEKGIKSLFRASEGIFRNFFRPFSFYSDPHVDDF